MGMEPILGVALGYMFKRIMNRLERQDHNYMTQDKALAILMSQLPPIADRLVIAESNINTLDKAQAVLQAHVDDHDKWAREQVRKAG